MRRPALNPHLQALEEQADWEWHFTQLADFIRRHGHADLGPHPVTDWLQRQRHSAHLKKLSPARQQRLSDLGIDIDQDVTPLIEEPDDEELPRKAPAQNLIALWETRYAELCAYQAEREQRTARQRPLHTSAPASNANGLPSCSPGCAEPWEPHRPPHHLKREPQRGSVHLRQATTGLVLVANSD